MRLERRIEAEAGPEPYPACTILTQASSPSALLGIQLCRILHEAFWKLGLQNQCHLCRSSSWLPGWAESISLYVKLNFYKCFLVKRPNHHFQRRVIRGFFAWVAGQQERQPRHCSRPMWAFVCEWCVSILTSTPECDSTPSPETSAQRPAA